MAQIINPKIEITIEKDIPSDTYKTYISAVNKEAYVFQSLDIQNALRHFIKKIDEGELMKLLTL